MPDLPAVLPRFCSQCEATLALDVDNASVRATRRGETPDQDVDQMGLLSVDREAGRLTWECPQCGTNEVFPR